MYSIGKAKVTIGMIAATLGLSESTVGKALRKRPEVSAAIRKLVLKQARIMGHVPQEKRKKLSPVVQSAPASKLPTIYDIAERVDFSPATVSRALNQSSRLKPETVEKIMAAARDMGFVMNTAAANLAAHHHQKYEQPPATIYTLAKALNLSAATVSQALAGNPSVPQRTRQRVLQKATELNFSPHADAVKLKKQPHFTLGLLVPKITHPVIVEIIASMEAWFAGMDMGIVMATYDAANDGTVRTNLDLLELVSNGNVYIPLMTGSKAIDWELKKPLVILDTCLFTPSGSDADTDRGSGAYYELGQRCAALFMDKMTHQEDFPPVPVEFGF